MHKIVVSEGLVLAKRNVAEASTVVSILTREHGLLRAKASATRVPQSKLRFGLEPLTFARFSFVEGRHEWKLVGVENIDTPPRDLTLRKRAALGRILKLLSRLLQGEESVPRLFEDVKAGLISMSFAANNEELRSVECVLVLRVLADLGYLPSDTTLEPFLKSSEFSHEVTLRAAESRSYLIRMINDSLAQTGL